MKQRTNIIDMFSTFLDVQDDNGKKSQWLYDKELKPSIEQQQKKPSLSGNLKQDESIWVKFWYDSAVENDSIKNIPQRHLQSYLQ